MTSSHIGVLTVQLGATLLAHNKELDILALLLSAGHHLADSARYERVYTCKIQHCRKGFSNGLQRSTALQQVSLSITLR